MSRSVMFLIFIFHNVASSEPLLFIMCFFPTPGCTFCEVLLIKDFTSCTGVMAAADDPPEVTIEPHLEMSYNKDMPGRIMFYCHQAPKPEEGGQTPVCDMRRVYQKLKDDPQISTLIDKGLRYYRTLPSRHSSQGILYSWEKTFFT